MNNPPENLEQLTSVPSPAIAAIIVNTLQAAGIEAIATGKHTTASQIASGEWVQVMVSSHDLPVAKNTLAKFREENAEIDWSQIDVGEPSDG